MNSLRLTYFITLFSICQTSLAIDSNSQFYDMLDGRFDVSGYLSENAYGFLPVPVIITDPAVDGGLGLIGLFFHETDDEQKKRLAAMKKADNKSAAKHLIPPSVTATGGAGTGNDSVFAFAGHMGFYKGGNIRYFGGIGHGDVNIDYYGSGSVSLNRPVEIKTVGQGILQSLKFKLPNIPVFAGVSQRYMNGKISPRTDENIDSALPTGFETELRNLLTREVALSAFGVNAEFDTRDNHFSPKIGYQYSFEYLWFRDQFGSDINYELTNLTGLNFWQLNNSWRLALKIDMEHARSERLLPPFATPSLRLRGIPLGRYQGELVAGLEAEVGWQIDSRWSILGFAGVGRASNSTSDFSDAPNRSAQGLGFRYKIARRYGFDMGVDVAKGPEETVYYITAGSAWSF